MKKRLLILLLIPIMMLSLMQVGCAFGKDNTVKDATSVMEKYWTDLYLKHDTGDGYFEIKNTRVVYLKDNDTEMFKDVRCIVEYELYTDFYSSAPYYINVGMYNNVVVYNDGTMEVQSNVIRNYFNKTFDYECPDFIDKIEDLKDEYNCSKRLR